MGAILWIRNNPKVDLVLKDVRFCHKLDCTNFPYYQVHFLGLNFLIFTSKMKFGQMIFTILSGSRSL